MKTMLIAMWLSLIILLSVFWLVLLCYNYPFLTGYILLFCIFIVISICIYEMIR